MGLSAVTGAASNDVFATDLAVNMTPDSVQVRTSSSVNNYGERSYSGDAVTFDAYIRRATSEEAGMNRDAVVEYVCWIPSTTADIDTKDQVTLPAPISDVRPVIKAETRRDPLGQTGVVLYVGSGAAR